MIIYTLNLNGPYSYGTEIASENFDKVIECMIKYNFFNRIDNWELEVWENGKCIAEVSSNRGIIEAYSAHNKDLLEEIYARFVMEKLVWNGDSNDRS